MRLSRSAAFLAASAIPFVAAQTSTECDPTKKSCPADTALNSKTFEADFTKGSGANASFSAAAYTTITYGDQGAEFAISKEGQAPTVQTDFYIFFGRIDVKMKAAAGTGIISSIVFESDDLDEIDWEFLGGDTTKVETNFFGKGNTTSYDRATYYPVSNPQSEFHTYTVDWNSDRIEWIIDGVTVHTLAFDDPLTLGGQNYPQTPMRLKLGNWCGGCSGEPEGTIEWAGGNTTFDGTAYTMYVESIIIQNYNPADQYVWSDETGSWQSIKIVSNGQSNNPTGSASSVPVTANPTGLGSASPTGSTGVNGTAVVTTAPTSSASVAPVSQQSGAVVSVTKTGSTYSMNTASVSAQNSGIATSVVSATTQVPGSSPTGSSGSNANASATSSGAATSQSGTSGAVINSILTAGSLLSVAAAFLLL